MKLNLAEVDCIFLSYDEPNAEKNYSDLLLKAPWAKRVHGVKGSDAAHKACANLSETQHFITVDADNIIDPKFFDLTIDTDKLPFKEDTQLSWAAKNMINGLVYGNGGLKCWTKDFVLNMQTHEESNNSTNKVDFCWQQQYTQMADYYSYIYNNSSPLQAWRAGFREGVKLSLSRGEKISLFNPKKDLGDRNYKRLLMWCSVGRDVENGIWAIYGARLGLHMTNCTDWNYIQVRDFDYLNSIFDIHFKDKTVEDIEKHILDLGNEIRLKLNMPVTELTSDQSKFFKAVWTNPPRTNRSLTESEVLWDKE
jgi:hypothetical protein